mmetsp:Transcript_17492/g.50793  ORF Transcript_17492/g.50793 Transcript_17492/m.50793 type:complete len:261 (+) Transcript_17492:1650-2432(+)
MEGTKWAKVTLARRIVETTLSKSRWPPSSSTTEEQPRTRGTHISWMDTSKVHVVLSTNTSSGVSSCTRMAHWKWAHSPDVGTMQPLGFPVEPEVYMTYMTSGGAQAGAASPMAASASLRAWASSAPSRCALARTRFTTAVSVTSMSTAALCSMIWLAAFEPESRMMAQTLASERISLMRDSGHAGSQGTKVAPALKAASSAIGSAAVRRSTRPTVKVPPFRARASSAEAAARISTASLLALACASSKVILRSVFPSVNHW